MDITYKKGKNGVCNFTVNFDNKEMLGYDEITSEVKCALITYSTELNTLDYEFKYETHQGPLPEIRKDSSDKDVNIHRVDKVEFFYIMKGNSEIILDFNFSLVSGHFLFDKIQLKFPDDLSKDFLDNTAKKIEVIVQHLFNQRGKLCVNCVWCRRKELSGFCDFEYQLNLLKKIQS